jgi:hypothetical protein
MQDGLCLSYKHSNTQCATANAATEQIKSHAGDRLLALQRSLIMSRNNGSSCAPSLNTQQSSAGVQLSAVALSRCSQRPFRALAKMIVPVPCANSKGSRGPVAVYTPWPYQAPCCIGTAVPPTLKPPAVTQGSRRLCTVGQHVR